MTQLCNAYITTSAMHCLAEMLCDYTGVCEQPVRAGSKRRQVLWARAEVGRGAALACWESLSHTVPVNKQWGAGSMQGLVGGK